MLRHGGFRGCCRPRAPPIRPERPLRPDIVDPTFINSPGNAANQTIQATDPGASTSPANWSTPAPFTGPCAAPVAQGPTVTVPALGPFGSLAMAVLFGAMGWRKRRQRT